MTIQEDIREGIAERLWDFKRSVRNLSNHEWSNLSDGGAEKRLSQAMADEIMGYEDSQGVVIKVKCPDCTWSQFKDGEMVGMTPCYSCNSTGYLVEPLIEEGK